MRRNSTPTSPATSPNSGVKLLATIAAGLTAAAIGRQASAAIIYTPASIIVDATNPQASVDFQQQGSPFVNVQYNAASAPAGTNPATPPIYQGLSLNKTTGTTNEPYYVNVSPTSNYIQALSYGDVIGTNIATSGFNHVPGIINDTNTSSQFVLNSTQYIGVAFSSAPGPSGTEDYGYIAFKILNDSSVASLQGEILGYAYDNSGANITAGAVPEPTTLALLALGAIGAMAVRRKRGLVG